MPTLKLWKNFQKRKNSTKAPSGSADASLTAYLKDGTSIEQPVFVIASNEFGYNYAQFEGSYYYVDDIVSLKNNLIEIHCSKDVLATYKSYIKASSAYVLYYSHSNTEIVDSRLSTKTAVTIDSSTESFNNLGTGESYMLTAVGLSRTSVFACSKSDVDELFVNQDLIDISTDYATEISHIKAQIGALSVITDYEMMKALANIFMDWKERSGKVTNSVLYCDDAQKFVKNCYVLPISKSNIGGTDHGIKLGKWNSNARGNMGFPRIVHDSATLNIPWQASDWRRNEPYHELYLYIPYIGMVNLPASECMGSNTLTVNVAIDTYSGVASFVVNLSNGAVVGQYSTNIAAPYAIGSSNVSLTEAGASLVNAGFAVGAAVAGNPSGLFGAALGLVNSIKPFPATIGSNGGAAGQGLGNTVKCFSVFHDTVVSPGSVSAIAGTPYNGVMSLSGISGYVQTSGASADMPAFGNDKDIVNSYLNGGIYIE